MLQKLLLLLLLILLLSLLLLKLLLSLLLLLKCYQIKYIPVLIPAKVVTHYDGAFQYIQEAHHARIPLHFQVDTSFLSTQAREACLAIYTEDAWK